MLSRANSAYPRYLGQVFNEKQTETGNESQIMYGC